MDQRTWNAGRMYRYMIYTPVEIMIYCYFVIEQTMTHHAHFKYIKGDHATFILFCFFSKFTLIVIYVEGAFI